MMRFLFAALATLALVTALALLFREDAGYVLIRLGPWQVETTVAFLLLSGLFAFVAGYLAIRFLVQTYRTPRRLAAWQRERRRRQARRALNQGLIALAEGKWSQAERLLLRHIEASENPLINYLAAARAAQQQGALDRRDRYLRLAHQAVPGADVAVGLSQAELQIAGRQMEQALATLQHLRQIAPRHEYVLRMLVRLHERLGDWEPLLELLPEARRRKVLAPEALRRLEITAWKGRIEQAGALGEADHLAALWRQVPRPLQQEPELALAQARQLQALGETAQAEGVLRKALHQHWDERLVDAYGRLPAEDPAHQLQIAEGWLEGHEHNPVLLLALGRIAVRARLWGKARGYLEASLAMHPTVEGYRLLAALLEQTGETQAAIEALRKGMALTAEDAAALPPPEDRPAPAHSEEDTGTTAPLPQPEALSEAPSRPAATGTERVQ